MRKQFSRSIFRKINCCSNLKLFVYVYVWFMHEFVSKQVRTIKCENISLTLKAQLTFREYDVLKRL